MGDSCSEVKEEPKAGDMSGRSYPLPSSPPRTAAHNEQRREPQKARGVFHGKQSNYFAVGITNSAPLPMLSGQRCMIDFCFV
jgi:hypothetical protein